MDVKIIGKPGSKAKLEIVKDANIQLYRGQANTELVINYGLVPTKLEAFYRKWSALKRIPILNRYVGCSKYQAIKDAENAGILVPETCMQLPSITSKNKWIEKRIHSSQGLGIKFSTSRRAPLNKYFQQFISDRRFELRVHAFQWLEASDWIIQKRSGPDDQIAWNFHQGGHFQYVQSPNKYKVFLEAKEVSKKILEIRGMAFGAVDLIVDNSMKVYFIEVNSSPGFTEYSKSIYIDAMGKLKKLSKSEIRALVG